MSVNPAVFSVMGSLLGSFSVEVGFESVEAVLPLAALLFQPHRGRAEAFRGDLAFDPPAAPDPSHQGRLFQNGEVLGDGGPGHGVVGGQV